MSWRERIGDAGSFRGETFFIDSDDTTLGRRTVTHQYPKRDKPYTEDMGRRAREYRMACYVLGPDYDSLRDNLMRALDKKGPGTLVHPYLGRMQVVVTRATKRETTREGGMARFELTFVEAGPAVQPATITDTAKGAKDAADNAKDKAGSSFKKYFDTAGQVQDYIDDTKAEIYRVLSVPGRLSDPVATAIAADIRTPDDLISGLQGRLAELREIAAKPLRAFHVYGRFFDAGDGAEAVPDTTPSRKREAANRAAFHALVRHSAVAEAARAAADASYDNADQALAIGNELQQALDAQMLAPAPDGGPIDDDLYRALERLYAAVTEDIRLRAAKLPRIVTRRLPATMPALAAAHRIYYDATRATALASRNGVVNPAFVPGGVDLEVLDDAA